MQLEGIKPFKGIIKNGELLIDACFEGRAFFLKSAISISSYTSSSPTGDGAAQSPRRLLLPCPYISEMYLFSIGYGNSSIQQLVALKTVTDKTPIEGNETWYKKRLVLEQNMTFWEYILIKA